MWINEWVSAEFQSQCVNDPDRSSRSGTRLLNLKADQSYSRETGEAIECDGDGPTNRDKTSRCGRKCQSSTTWLLAALVAGGDGDAMD